jgi:hypothetical protein
MPLSLQQVTCALDMLVTGLMLTAHQETDLNVALNYYYMGYYAQSAEHACM